MKKTYVITGATSGIGKALTEHFAKENLVFAGYRNPEKIKELPQNVIPFYINAEDEQSISEAIKFIKSKTIKIDSLINVAGCVVAGAMEHIETKELRRQFEVNVFSHLQLSQGLLDILENGKIINISSMASYGIFPFVAPYCASKRTLDILFNALQVEFKRNIKIISIKPGVIATPLWEKSINENKESFESCTNYGNELKFMIKNAKDNEIKGIPVEKLVDKIIKIEALKNPKPSYTIGLDAKFAEIASHLPQSAINQLIKIKLAQKAKSLKM